MTSSFYRLIIDTSSEHSLMGIAQNRKILASQISIHSNQLSQTLIPSLQTLLEESGVRLDQLDEIAVGIGPGSYTGTRVGVSIARGLSFALKSRLQNSSTQQNRPFEALCAPASSQSTSKSSIFLGTGILQAALKKPALRSFCSLLAFLPPLQGTFACVMPSKTGDFYLLKGLRSQDRLTCIQSSLLDRSALIEAIAGVDILVGKPLKDLEARLPSFAGSWTQPDPTLEPILDYLETPVMAGADQSWTDLIYLHKP